MQSNLRSWNKSGTYYTSISREVFFSLKKSKLPCTEYMDKCCKLITKACWDGNFCFVGHFRLDENKTPMLQSPALQNKLFWAHNFTHDQANWAGSLPGIWGAGQQVNQPSGRSRARQPASQAACKPICHSDSQEAGKLTHWLSPWLPRGTDWELVSQASHLPARATTRIVLLPAAFCQWLWRNACSPMNANSNLLAPSCRRRIYLSSFTYKKYVYLICWVTDSCIERLVYRKTQEQFRIKTMKCNLPANQLHLHHYSNLGFQGALLLCIWRSMSRSAACHLLPFNLMRGQRVRPFFCLNFWLNFIWCILFCT